MIRSKVYDSLIGVVIINALLGWGANLFAATGKVTVAWEPIEDPEVGGYTIVWGEASKSYSASQSFGVVSEGTVELEAGKTYFMAVRGFDKQGVPGELSNEVTAIVKGPDSKPPVISGVSIGNISNTSATISFHTDEEAYVQIEYGKSTSLGSFTGLTNVSSTTHAVTLSSLSSSTNYHFRMIAKDLSGNQVVSEILTFRTQAGPDDSNNDPNAPVKFLQITLSNVSNTSVTINWTTDKPTTGFIEYGLSSTGFPFNGGDPIMTATHASYLAGLSPSTLYRYRITATTSDNKQATSAILMFKTSDRVSQPARPSPEAIFIQSVVENARFRTNLGINNFSETVANVSMTLVDKDGLVLGTKTVQVEGKGLRQINSVARFLYEDSLGADVRGNIYLESDQPISAWASQIDNSTNDPSMLLSKRTGATRILIPSTANISTFSSSLVLMNLGFTTAQISLKAYSTSGAVIGQSSTPLTLAPNGVLSFENILQTLGVSDNYGPLEITSLNGAPIVATSRVSSTNGSGGFFEGLSYYEAGLTQTIPHVVDTNELRTNLGINNAGDQLATVTVRLFDMNGLERGSTVLTVAPRGLTQLNNVIRLLANLSDVSSLEGWIRLESNQPVVGWVSQIDNATNDPGFAVSKGQGASRLLVQSTANVGSFRSSLVVVNPGSESASVDIIARDSNGRETGRLAGVLIPARGYYAVPNILEALGVAESYGPIEILSNLGQPILATSRVYSTSGTSGFFEGQRVE
ncbi:MAG: DUF5719 family protein [Acidobacteriota bacterium]